MSEPEEPKDNRDFSFTARRAAQLGERRLRVVGWQNDGGSSGGGTDPWQQSVENRLGQLDGHILDIRQ